MENKALNVKNYVRVLWPEKLLLHQHIWDKLRWVDCVNIWLVVQGHRPSAALHWGSSDIDELGNWILALQLDFLALNDYVYISTNIATLQQRLPPQGFQLRPEDHLEIGRFLNVPNCCLRPWMISSAQATESAATWIENNNMNLNFLPHLPCKPLCSESFNLAQKYSGIIMENSEDLWKALWDLHSVHPLLLY